MKCVKYLRQLFTLNTFLENRFNYLESPDMVSTTGV